MVISFFYVEYITKYVFQISSKSIKIYYTKVIMTRKKKKKKKKNIEKLKIQIWNFKDFQTLISQELHDRLQ